MERKFNKKNFDIMIKILLIILKVSIILAFVAGGILIVGFLAVLIVTKTEFNFDLELLNHVNLTLGNIWYDVSAAGFSGTINIKNITLIGIMVISLNLLFYQYIQIVFSKFLRNIKNDNLFSVENTVKIKNIGIAFIIASLVINLANSALYYYGFDLLNITEFDINFGINTTYLFTGLIILVVAYVFDYGSYLQEEHDGTV